MRHRAIGIQKNNDDKPLCDQYPSHDIEDTNEDHFEHQGTLKPFHGDSDDMIWAVNFPPLAILAAKFGRVTRDELEE